MSQENLSLKKAFVIIGLAAVACAAIIAFVGCSNKSSEPKAEESTPNEQEWVVGEVVDIVDNEITLESTSDSTELLIGPVRVGTQAIDAAVMNNIAVGTTIKVHYSGQVGMSAPPFISAISIDLQ